jgi:superoxide dismutase, Fe-Mn family
MNNLAERPNAASANGPEAASGPSQHVLPPLPYDYAALEPCIDARTMKLHHDKHHASYVEKLNAALEPYAGLRKRSAPWLLLNSDLVPEAIRTAVHNNAGGHLNHSLFWQSMSPADGSGPTGKLAAAIEKAFGGLEQFKTAFDDAGSKVFGSGWVWLVVASAKGTNKPPLEIVTTSGHDNPILQGKYPLLLNDVWEHAYYLKHENRRPDYLKNWWTVVNWKEAMRRFEHPDASTEAEPAEGYLADPLQVVPKA